MHIIAADDHEIARSGLMLLLRDEFPEARISEASDLEEAIQLMSPPADLLLVDLHMPGMANNADLEDLCAGFPSSKIVIVSGDEERDEVFSALAAGVRGYIFKSQRESEMKAALHQVLGGGIYVPPALGYRQAPRTPPPPTLGPASPAFTERQKMVFAELLKGKTSKDIAEYLKIAEGTVRIHLQVIYRTLGVRSRAEAIAKYQSSVGHSTA